jgi:predicted acylesterase/phospholipase RssA/CRP-like cAMP-binding protein
MKPSNVSLNKAAIIKKIPLFADLSDEARNLIEEKSYVAEYRKDHILYREGDPPGSFYCIITGRVNVFVKTPSGSERTLINLHRGDYVGIISLLTNEPHSASVRIVNDALILRIDKSDFSALLKEVPQLAIKLSESLSRRLKKKDAGPKSVFESTIISVFGLAGKAGRTMYAVNLAVALAYETRKKVILLDMSKTGEECASMLRADKKPLPVDLKTLAFDHDKVKPLIADLESSGICLLNVAYDSDDPSELTQLGPLLSYLAAEFNYIVVDLPIVIDKAMYAVLTQSDLMHIITDCDEHNLKATGSLIGELNKDIKDFEAHLKVIMNEFAAEKTFEECVRALGHKPYATLPDLGLLGGIMSMGLPPVLAVPNSLYSRTVRRIARDTGKILVGLALSSGAALGLAHVGVMKVLEREKIPIDFIAGTSIGAVVGAFWASGMDAAELERAALRFKSKRMLLSLADFSLFPLLGFINGRNLSRFFGEYLGRKTFHDTHTPIKIISSTLRSRQLVVIDDGRLVDALRASCSIPAVIKPCRKEDDFLIDGGTLDPVPVDVLSKLGAKKIIAVNCLPSPAEILKPFQEFEERRRKEELRLAERSIFARAIFKFKNWTRRTITPNFLDVLMNSSLSMQYVLAEASSREADCVLHPIIPTVNWFELYKVEILIKRGEEEAERMLPQIKALIEE